MSLTADMEDRFIGWFESVTAEMLNHTVVLLSGLLLAECVLFLSVPSVESYETSLVNAFPMAFWVLFYGVLLGGICVIVLAAATDTPYWRHGAALVTSNYAIFFFLPEARGYGFYHRGKADVLRHLGDVKGIISAQALPTLFYPGEHTLMAEFSMIGIPLRIVPYITAFLFTALFILGVGVLVGTLTGRWTGVAVGVAVASPLVFISLHLTNHPAMLSFMTLPIFLAFLERYRRTNAGEYLAILLILGLFVLYTHPMTTIFMSILIITTALYSQFHARFVDATIPALNPRLGLVFPVLLFGWVNNFKRTKLAVIKVAEVTDEPTPSGRATQKAAEITFTPMELLGKFLNLYGTLAVYCLVAGLIVLSLSVAIARRDISYKLGLTVTQFAVGSGLLVAFIGVNIIVNRIVRASRYALLFAAVIIALTLLARLERRDIVVAVLLVVAVLGTAVIGASGAYEPNHHMTYSEYDGTEFTERYNGEEVIYSAKTSHKMEEFVLGTNSPDLWPPHIASTYAVPRNLGYSSESQTAADTFGDSLLVTKEFDREQHTADYYTREQQELLFIYGEESMTRLNDDRTANKVYTNGKFMSWDISSDS